MEFDIDSILEGIAPILKVGGKLLTDANALDSQVDNFADASRYSAGVLTQGYDEQLGKYNEGYDAVRDTLNKGLDTVSNISNTGVYGYEDASKKNVSNYEAQIRPELNQLTAGLSGANDLYSAQLDKTAAKTEGTLQQGADDYAAQLMPYTDSGAEALAYLQSILGNNPNDWTPQQQQLLKDFTRDSRAELAASDLRGAGRAGVAAVNEGRAKLQAELYDQNQRRQDAAAATLNTQGYAANSNVANTNNAMKKTVADMQYKTGNAQATSGLETNQNIAKTAFGVGQDIGNKGYAVGQDINKTKLANTSAIANLTNQNVKNQADITGSQYAAQGNNALNKALVNSTTASNIGSTQYAADDALRQQMGTAIDKLTTAVAQKKSTAAKTV